MVLRRSFSGENCEKQKYVYHGKLKWLTEYPVVQYWAYHFVEAFLYWSIVKQGNTILSFAQWSFRLDAHRLHFDSFCRELRCVPFVKHDIRKICCSKPPWFVITKCLPRHWSNSTGDRLWLVAHATADNYQVRNWRATTGGGAGLSGLKGSSLGKFTP